MRQPTTLLLAAALLATGACASAGTSADGEPRAARSSSSTNLLGPAEIEGASQRNMRDVITALRPRWVQNTNARDFDPRSTSELISVYVNGRPSGGLDALSGIDKSAVERVIFYTLSEAQGRFGSVVRAPVIDVRLKVGG